ncbi:glycosyltransferase [Pantoea sp. Seng]|uniref:glycosyltransferase n=1 Tax=Pantoea sp. Seng TaxID=2576761 RepID=UPI001321CFF5|nr:glycosyltransferase [Pantoea sp. Seng]MXP52768.1 glycosyltransferase [Pantoea sp. Seng]
MPSLKENPIISVIIPVYKTEKYIAECLDSVLTQKLGRKHEKRTIEIICVNDESPDNSKKIIEDYLIKNNNIVLIEQKNQGQSVARNNALKIAKGDYVFFLDSDDLLPDDAFSSLIKVADETGSEVIVSHAKAFNGRRSWYIQPHAEVASASLRKVKFFHRSILVNTPPPWGKLYSRNLIERNNIQFPVGIKLAEDWIFVMTAMYKANHISSTPEISYLYRGRDDEDNPSCTQVVNAKVFSDLVKVYGLTKKFNLPTQQTKYAKLFILRGILYRLSKFSVDNDISTCKPTLIMISQFLKEEIDLSMLKTFTPIRRLPLLLIYHGFLSESHRIMNSVFQNTCIRRGSEVSEELIVQDFNFLREKSTQKGNRKSLIRHNLKKYNQLKWSLKYTAAKILSKIIYKNKKISLIGERLGNTANDSSFHLFKYISEKKQSSKIKNDYYFVIKKDAKTKGNLNKLNNVLIYGSFKHFLIFHSASNYIFSDSMRDVFHRWKDVSKEHSAKNKYFLQHGIFALNRAAGYYDANSMLRRDELPNKFIVSSEHERNLVCKNFGFKKSEVAVTGLSRFDKLPKNNLTKNKKILLLFTWRDSLNNVNSNKFLTSKYFKRLSEILQSNELQRILQSNGYTIEACLHHKLHKYIGSAITASKVNIHSMNECDVQSLIINSDAMITDFSSASFDMLYQNKPVLYYWFDEEQFFGKRGGPLIDPLNDIPGEIYRDFSSLQIGIERLIKEIHNPPSNKTNKSKIFFKYKDNDNCRRILELIDK